MRRVSASAVLLLVLVGCGPGGETSRTLIQNKGSDTLVNVAQSWAEAYKDVSEVVDVMDRVGISLKVAKLRPLGVAKG